MLEKFQNELLTQVKPTLPWENIPIVSCLANPSSEGMGSEPSTGFELVRRVIGFSP